MDRLFTLLIVLGICGATACSATTNRLDPAVLEAHLRSDAKCAGALGQILAREGTRAALTTLGIKPGSLDAASEALGKLSGATETKADPATMLSFAEVCSIVIANAEADISALKARVGDLRARIKARRAK